MAITRKNTIAFIPFLHKHCSFTRNLSANYSSRSSEEEKHEMMDKVKESMYNSEVKTGGNLKEPESTEQGEDESIVDSYVDEGDIANKVAKERGGKPVDEVKGLDVNLRPIDEDKSPSS